MGECSLRTSELIQMMTRVEFAKDITGPDSDVEPGDGVYHQDQERKGKCQTSAQFLPIDFLDPVEGKSTLSNGDNFQAESVPETRNEQEIILGKRVSYENMKNSLQVKVLALVIATLVAVVYKSHSCSDSAIAENDSAGDDIGDDSVVIVVAAVRNGGGGGEVE
ncbi:Hypothetical predicted protein [Octopus vulgaris]|uniref:Uncharacterized protein n=1 Tax=Octopus vulgaris TaxID=6645 RepID=A0AA36AG61_OCTVU|nr:Hypothetical predicted protein [Octopus vulgaris]